MKPMTVRRTNGRAGFTLMEVAMAIMVMGIGLVASFGLLTSGLDASTLAQNDTQATIFADNVLNSLRAMNLDAAGRSTPQNTEWETFWEDLKKARVLVPLTPDAAWDQALFWEKNSGSAQWGDSPEENENKKGVMGLPMVGRGSTVVRRIDFQNASFPGHTRGNRDITNHSIRYRLRIDQQNDPPRVFVLLEVWPGKFGNEDTEEPLTYYTELNNPGNL